MIQLDNAFIGGISEIRNLLPSLIKKLEKAKVILTKRGKPVAVLQSYEKYEENKKIIEAYENALLLKVAQERDKDDATSISAKEMEDWLLAQ